jgi:2-dehydro-3-deoxyphosphogluconate aldolase/(4S)-4-hydroxy-2-oxoglutarate aldolase
MLVGAGTVTSVDMAEDAINAGAEFIVSPGLDREVVEYCIGRKVLVIPGIATPSEAQLAVKLGLSMIKVYPAEILGGTGFIKSLTAVYKSISIMPSGGINADNMLEYMDTPHVVSCGGSWVCPYKLIVEEKFDEIEQIARASVLKMHGFQLIHVGLNSEDGQEAKRKAEDFSEMLGLPLKEGDQSIFAGNMFEILKKPLYGEHGHIAIRTNYMDRAVDYFEKRGYRFRDKPKENVGSLPAIYFEKEIGGFAIHLRARD